MLRNLCWVHDEMGEICQWFIAGWDLEVNFSQTLLGKINYHYFFTFSSLFQLVRKASFNRA